MRYTDVVIEATDVTAETEKTRLSFMVRVLTSPAGELANDEAQAFSFDWPALQQAIARLEAREMSREELRAFGARLADWLLPRGEAGAQGVRELYEASLAQAEDGSGVRLRLRLPPRLAWIPWEYLYIPGQTPGNDLLGFLALNPQIALVRHEMMRLKTPLIEAPDDVLRIVAAFAQADGTRPLNLEQEEEELRTIFAGHPVEPVFLQQSTIAGILENIPRASIFHFAGHGDFAVEAERPRTYSASNTLLMSGHGSVDPEQLSLNLRGNGLRLAVLASCLGAKRAGPTIINLWESLARTLIVSGVPAVVANQFTILDRSALAFSQAFYKALLGGLSVERAVIAGRLAIYNSSTGHPDEDPSGRDWGVPVLYMRARDGHLLAGSADLASRKRAQLDIEALLKGIVQAVADDPNESPLDPPQLPKHYVERLEQEEALTTLLTAPEGDKLTVVAGGEGVGKGTVVAAVANRLHKERVFQGVLWADCAGATIQDVLQDLAKSLGLIDQGQSLVTRNGRTGAKQIWSELNRRAQNGRLTLVVVDNVSDTNDIPQLLPEPATPCRLVVITDAPVAPKAFAQTITVEPLDSEQTFLLFKQLLGAHALLSRDLDSQRGELDAIGKLYGYLPAYIVTAAKRILAEGITPSEMLRQLQSQGVQEGGLAMATAERHELLLQGLSSQQREIFSLIEVVGTGSINIQLLAGMALCTVDEVKKALATLAERGLLKGGGETGYSILGTYENLAKRIFKQRTPYEQRTAVHMFVRVCLDMVQSIVASQRDGRLRDDVSEQEELQRIGQAISERLLPQIRRALELVDADPLGWELLKRFGSNTPISQFTDLVQDRGVVYMDLRMAAIEQIVLGAQPDLERKIAEAWGYDTYGLIGLIDSNQRLQWPETPEAEARLEPYLHAFDHKRLEAHLTLAATRLNGVIIGADLVGANWKGVLAPLLVFRNVTMYGARLIACDFAMSTWRDCNAARADLTGSDLSDAVLRDVILHGAVLRDVNLNSAVLERVDLSNAILVRTNLSNAKLREVRLFGTQLENVVWNGATFVSPALETLGRQSAEVERQAQQPGQQAPPAYGWAISRRSKISSEELNNELADAPENALLDLRCSSITRLEPQSRAARPVDLAAADVGTVTVIGGDLSHSYATAATVGSLQILSSHLYKTDIQAAYVRNGVLLDVRIEGCTFYAATFEQALLHGCYFVDSTLYGLALLQSGVARSSFSKIDLRNAHFYECTFDDVSFNGAMLGQSRFRGCEFRHRIDLREADLSEAAFVQVCLRGADLRRANLAGAILLQVDLSEALVDEEQLRQASCLAGSILPNGALYMGQWSLEGDRQHAQHANVDLQSPAALREFYQHAAQGRAIFAAVQQRTTLSSLDRLLAKLPETVRSMGQGMLVMAQDLFELKDASLTEVSERCQALHAIAAGDPFLALMTQEIIMDLQPRIATLRLRQLRDRLDKGDKLEEQISEAIAQIREIERKPNLNNEQFVEQFYDHVLDTLRQFDLTNPALTRAFAEHLCDPTFAYPARVFLFAQIYQWQTDDIPNPRLRSRVINLLSLLLDGSEEESFMAVVKAQGRVVSALRAALAAVQPMPLTAHALERLAGILEQVTANPEI